MSLFGALGEEELTAARLARGRGGDPGSSARAETDEVEISAAEGLRDLFGVGDGQADGDNDGHGSLLAVNRVQGCGLCSQATDEDAIHFGLLMLADRR